MKHGMKHAIFSVVLALFFTYQLDAQTHWKIDRTHSNIDFAVRYMMLSNVRGTYTDFDAVLIQTNEDFSDSRVEVTIRAASINTQNNDRDNHLRSNDFFDVDNYPVLTFVSNKFEKVGNDRYRVLGDLTIRGVTKPVELDAELIGMIDDPRGYKRVAFTAQTSINRNDFNVQWNRALEAGGFVVGNTVNIMVSAQFIMQE